MASMGVKANVLISAVAAVLIMGCAQVSAPTGGPKDETPPLPVRVDPPSESVNLRPDRLVLQFDEFVALRSPLQQLVVSPPLSSPPEWRIRGKAVELTLDSSAFEADRTYVFAFGGAIVDLHESNPAEDLKWAFSTGAELDTLKVRGRVTDRMSRSGVSDLRVLLYQSEIPWDSIWAGRRPDALGQTNQAGEFSFDYLSPGAYKGVAFDDANGNYRWDDGEYVALDTAAFESGTAGLNWLGNETPEPEPPARISSCQLDTMGMMRVAVPEDDEVPESWYVLMANSPQPTQAERDGDSVMVWSPATEGADLEELRLVWIHGKDSDTARVRLNLRSGMGSFSPRSEPPIRSMPQSERSWKFDRAVFIEDADKLVVKRDSIALDAMAFGASSADEWTRTFSLDMEEEFGSNYTIQFLPGALRLQGRGLNEDTLTSVWATHPEAYFGELSVAITDVPGAGWFRLDEDRFYIESDTSMVFPLRSPGKAEMGFEWDANCDSIWQSAEPHALQVAEPYFCPAQQPEIRSNWLVEWEWSLAEKEPEE